MVQFQKYISYFIVVLFLLFLSTGIATFPGMTYTESVFLSEMRLVLTALMAVSLLVLIYIRGKE